MFNAAVRLRGFGSDNVALWRLVPKADPAQSSSSGEEVPQALGFAHFRYGRATEFPPCCPTGCRQQNPAVGMRRQPMPKWSLALDPSVRSDPAVRDRDLRNEVKPSGLPGLVRHAHKRRWGPGRVMGLSHDADLQCMRSACGNSQEGYERQEERPCERRQATAESQGFVGRKLPVKPDEPTNRLERRGQARKEFDRPVEARGVSGAGAQRVQDHIRLTAWASTHHRAQPGRSPVFSSGDKGSGCAARAHVLTQGDL